MADRLDTSLRALDVAWPPTPDLAAAVTPRLAPRRRRRWIPVVVAVAGLAVAAPAVGDDVLELLGLRGARVERREPPPAPPQRPGTLGSGLRLGRAIGLEDARRRFRFPASLATPDAAWIDAGRVSLVYASRPGIPRSPHTAVAVLLTRFEGAVTPVLGKALGAGAGVERIELEGARGYLITGKPHGFAWIAPGGDIAFEDRRLAGTTLLVERDDGVLLRAEGRLRIARARALARELARG
jgi:hypothetical protein